MKFIRIFLLTSVIMGLMAPVSQAQLAKGNKGARRNGVHSGNMVRTVFTNYGCIGQPGDQGPMAAWKYNTNGYVGDISPVVGVRLPIRDYIINHHLDGKPDTLYSVVICPVDRPGGFDSPPDGSIHWGFEPIPGFCNLSLDKAGEGVAMSHLPETWPEYWPDHPDWRDPQGKAEWNGYFGRGMMNADQESYFMMDDNADQEMYLQYGFLPDSSDPSRKGQGLQVKVRGLQWGHFLAQDVMFWLYEIKNIGKQVYDQSAFGLVVGTYVGAAGDEWNDDASFFNIRESITYTWDFDHYINPAANPKWQPNPGAVGYIGYAFLESPGNQFDGIDNDGDAASAPVFTEQDFQPHTVKAGEKLVLIDKATYKRSTFIMPSNPVTVTSLGNLFRLVPDSTILEEGNMQITSKGFVLNTNAFDGIDNDLDGLIDENYQVHYKQYKKTLEGVVLIDTLNQLRHKDYINGLGLNDPLVDEARNDGIDNDGDWDSQMDDTGADGKPGTHDIGEGDGMPTEGEPNFDSKDIDESDQIGLTNFQYFVPSSDIDMSDENDMWSRLQPGKFDVPKSIVNNRAIKGEDGDFLYGSGLFPMLPGTTERFSLALVFGDDYQGVIRNKRIAQMIYDANYNFPRPPEKPTLSAVASDNKVTLYWDKVAEASVDVSLKEKDFEGYKIYKSTDPDFSDIKVISNGYGETVDYKPLVQYDLANGIKGFFNSDPLLYELSSGKPFYLGEDTGIKNTYVDEDVINGKTYYYAVVAYDHGKASTSIYPSENTKTIYVNAAGQVTLDKNTVMVTPQAPIAGYVPPASGVRLARMSGSSTPVPYIQVVDPTKVKDATYFLTFNDSLYQDIQIANSFNLTDSATGQVIFSGSRNFLSTNGDIFDGMYLSINKNFQVLDSLNVDTTKSGWSVQDTSHLSYTVTQLKMGNIQSIRCPYDYMFVFENDYKNTSSALRKIFGNNSPLKEKKCNFSVYNVTDKSHPVKVEYGFVDKPGSAQDTLSNFDVVILSNPDGSQLSWRLTFQGTNARPPAAGDTLRLSFMKPFSSADKFVYRSKAIRYNQSDAKASMDRIRAVPNPYVVSNMFEKPLPPQVRGRGERVIYFNNLPPKSKIHIYSSNGDHIITLEHDGNYQNGSLSWDLRTKEGLDVSFGVYFYIVEAEGIDMKKTGKLAIIK
ncbi:MAG: hypothetical protein ACM3SM_10455 [Bacteroidota bacterium]